MKGETRSAKRRRPEPKVIDLMDALRASVERARDGEKKPAKRSTKATRSKRGERKPASRKTAKRSAA
jgi:non-homologous end joining protein Ku